MTDHTEDNDDGSLGITTEDVNVTHRAAFMTLMKAWDGRLIAEENGQPADILAFRAEMETAFQHYKASMATLAMIDDVSSGIE